MNKEGNDEKLKITVDNKGIVKVWINGRLAYGISKIKFECEAPNHPIIEIGLAYHSFRLEGDN